MAKTAQPESRFVQATAEDVYRLVVRSWGLDKAGKNHFGFTGPSPIYGLYFDPGGIEGVAQKFVRGEVEGQQPKEIFYTTQSFNKKKNTQDHACDIRDKFLEDYAYAIKHARLIQIDETELWEIFRFAEFGGESDVPREYGPLNGQYRGLIQDAYDAGVNLQLIQKVKEKWVNNKPTGKMDPMGFKQANYIVQANLEHRFNTETKEFDIEIVNCRQNMTIAGDVNSNITWADLGQLIYPESSEEDWQ